VEKASAALERAREALSKTRSRVPERQSSIDAFEYYNARQAAELHVPGVTRRECVCWGRGGQLAKAPAPPSRPLLSQSPEIRLH
jgi:hypothetical protein